MLPKHTTRFHKLDAEHALAASTSIHIAIDHLGAATAILELGVPCENCEELRSVLTFLDCATSLLQGAMERLRGWPKPPAGE